MHRGERGQALLIAVILTLILTILSVHLVTVAKLEYDGALVRRYTKNTGFHAESVVHTVVDAIDKGITNYEAEMIDQMMPYILAQQEHMIYAPSHLGETYQLTMKQLGVIAKAYAYRWVVQQYFNQYWGSLDLSVYGQKPLEYQMQTDRASEQMITFVKARVFVKGMKGAAGDTGWLDSVPIQEVEELVDYGQVKTLIKQLETSLKNQDWSQVESVVLKLETLFEAPCFLIEGVAQTREGTQIYDTQQRLGKVRLDVPLAMEVTVCANYQWRDQTTVLKIGRADIAYALAEEAQGAIVHTSEQRIDISQYYGEDNKPCSVLLILEGDGPVTLYTSKVLRDTFRGIVIGEAPVQVEGDLKRRTDASVFFEIGSSYLQRQLIEGGLWSGISMEDVGLSEKSRIAVLSHQITPRLVTLKDGRMVDKKG
ncbi:MAG: hypothetical protein ACRCTE_06945 [Cellulosilyticaceae bacterium]